MILIVMGVSGSGKTTVGKLLADRLDYRFLDADDYHPHANIEKMKAGTPLTDGDRAIWLERLRDMLSGNDRIVMACSALKQAYRDVLMVGSNVTFVYLKAERELIKKRFKERADHFMSPALIDSQFETLEEPGSALTIDAASSPEATVNEVVLVLSQNPGDA